MPACSATGLLCVLQEEGEVSAAVGTGWLSSSSTGRSQAGGTNAGSRLAICSRERGTVVTRGHTPALPRELLLPLGSCGPEGMGQEAARSFSF